MIHELNFDGKSFSFKLWGGVKPGNPPPVNTPLPMFNRQYTDHNHDNNQLVT